MSKPNPCCPDVLATVDGGHVFGIVLQMMWNVEIDIKEVVINAVHQ